jgi:fructose-1,6-bisphosphatase/sedoheptulose 1,7-bisphosphatase-like protein
MCAVCLVNLAFIAAGAAPASGLAALAMKKILLNCKANNQTNETEGGQNENRNNERENERQRSESF